MKLTARNIDKTLRAPESTLSAILLYGPDVGLIGERRKTVVGAVLGGQDDPFRLANLNVRDIAADPARLRDEVDALSFDGQRRVVVVSDGNDRLAGELSDLIDHPSRGALLVVEAGDLPPRSKLRKAFEQSDYAAAAPCYADSSQDLQSLIDAELSAAGVSIQPDARAYLVGLLGGDRLASRQEVAKLALYKSGDHSPVSIDDIDRCVGDVSAKDLDHLAFTTLLGRMKELEPALATLFDGGENPVTILRAVGRLLLRLHQAAVLSQDMGIEGALKKLRPPVFFKQAPDFKRLLNQWPTARLESAINLVTDAEISCKSTDMPAAAICRQTLLRLARGGQAGAR